MNISALTAIILLAGSPSGEQAEYSLTAKYLVGQEIVYIGRLVDTTSQKENVKYEQPFELETSLFVLEVDPKQTARLGCYTVIRRPDHRPDRDKSPFENVVSLRFDDVRVVAAGRATWSGNDARVSWPTDGWPTSELSYLIEVPSEPIHIGATWVSRDSAPQPTNYQLVAREPVEGVLCLKVEGTQQSQNWKAKEVTTAAWQRKTTVWLDPKTGLARRVRWEHHLRDPGAESPGRVITASYNQASNLRYHGSLLQERTTDFHAAHKAQRELEHAVSSGERHRRRQLTTVQQQLQQATDAPFSTPYRPAMAEMLRWIERAIKEKPEVASAPNTLRIRSTAEIGRPARPFVVHDLGNNQTITLKKLAGKPIVLVIADPTSDLSIHAVAQAVGAVATQAARTAEVLVVCTKTDQRSLAELKERVRGRYTLCGGKGLDGAYGVEGTPHTIFIDGEGILRANYQGHGPETITFLAAALARHARPVSNIGANDAGTGKYLR
jgi:hypothetical protein